MACVLASTILRAYEAREAHVGRGRLEALVVLRLHHQREGAQCVDAFELAPTMQRDPSTAPGVRP